MKLLADLIVSKWCSLKADEDATTSKSFKIELLIPSGTTVRDMAIVILSNYVIKWQNANRKRYTKLVDKSTHKLTFKRPITEIDPIDAMMHDAKLAGIDITDTDALTVYIMERLTKQTK